MSNKEQTNAEKTWDEIKGRLINMFALPNQTIEMYLEPAFVEPSHLYLTVKDKNATAVLPALEQALMKDFTVEVAGRFLRIVRVNKALF